MPAWILCSNSGMVVVQTDLGKGSIRFRAVLIRGTGCSSSYLKLANETDDVWVALDVGLGETSPGR